MRIRCWFKRCLLLALLCVMGVGCLYWLYRPSPVSRKEIFKGVFLTVEETPRTNRLSHNRLMIVEVHWDTPGIQLANRPFDYPVDPSNPVEPHYRLTNADWALARSGASVLVNTTGYAPEKFYRSLPGLPVRSSETVVVEGHPSHIHAHSYLMYWDRTLQAHMVSRKPPDPDSLADAFLGIGLQGIPVAEGQARYHALGNKELVMPRTFIGIDPGRKILWLMAFEKASGRFMIDRAVKEGVIYGGMVDSGSASHLLVGSGASGIRSHTGIRHWRPLGPYLTVFAEPL